MITDLDGLHQPVGGAQLILGDLKGDDGPEGGGEEAVGHAHDDHPDVGRGLGEGQQAVAAT